MGDQESETRGAGGRATGPPEPAVRRQKLYDAIRFSCIRGQNACVFAYDKPVQSASAVAPTRVRFLTLALCIAMAMLLYLDRYAISPVTGTLLAELKVSKEQLGRTIFFAFFFAYALCQIPAGWLSDVFGARRMLALYVAGWSLATIAMGLVNGLAAIFFVRFVLGVSQAGAYPTAASLLKRWIPYGARGLANSSVSMGGRAGGLLAFAVDSRAHAPRRALARMGDGTLARGVRTLWSTRPGLGGGFCLDVSRLSPRSSLVQRERGRADRAPGAAGRGRRSPGPVSHLWRSSPAKKPL